MTLRAEPLATMADLERIEQDSFGQMRLILNNGQQIDAIRTVRSFPITEPDFGISLVDRDGREVAWIEQLSQCPPAIQQAIRDSLAMRDFLPVIQRILDISSNNEPCEWQVQTDRGPLTFVLNSDEDVRRLDAKRAIVTDGNKVQYLVQDFEKLDTTTRKYLERYLS
jgi:hypothetical protein